MKCSIHQWITKSLLTKLNYLKSVNTPSGQRRPLDHWQPILFVQQNCTFLCYKIKKKKCESDKSLMYQTPTSISNDKFDSICYKCSTFCN